MTRRAATRPLGGKACGSSDRLATMKLIQGAILNEGPGYRMQRADHGRLYNNQIEIQTDENGLVTRTDGLC